MKACPLHEYTQAWIVDFAAFAGVEMHLLDEYLARHLPAGFPKECCGKENCVVVSLVPK